MKKIAQGNTAEVYEYTATTICKLFKENYSKTVAEMEYNNARMLHRITKLSPTCHELVCIDGRVGLIYDKLQGNDLLQEAAEDFSDTNRILGILDELVDMHKRLLSYEMEQGNSYKSFLSCLVPSRSSEYAQIMQQIEALPDGNTLCHGDFHPGNLWRNKDGSLSIIDSLTVCRGPKEYDIARTYFLLTEEWENEEAILPLKKYLGEVYLEKMGYNTAMLEDYLRVITACRKYELGKA